jgi:hypothetical protein
MPTPLGPVNICNVALSKIGSQPINSLTDQSNPAAVACNTNYDLARLEVSRTSRWNCLMGTAVLSPVYQPPLSALTSAAPPTSTPWTANTLVDQGVYLSYSGAYYLVLNTFTTSSSFATDLASGNLQLYNSNGSQPVNAVPWAPNTFYEADTYLTYGNYYYMVMFTYTSTNNFANDLTTGALTQTNLPTTQTFFVGDGQGYASGWAFAYALPSDYVLLVSLNGNTDFYWGGFGDTTADYEIIGPNLYCDQSQAVVQYVQDVKDTTRFDPMFTNCMALKLAAMVSTVLRQDGGRMEAALLQEYERALSAARTKNAGEQQQRRFNPIPSSLFNRSRFWGVNG